MFIVYLKNSGGYVPRGDKKAQRFGGQDMECPGKPTTRYVSSTKPNQPEHTRTGRESEWRVTARGSISPRLSAPAPIPAFLAKSKPSLPESTPPSSVAKAAADPGSQRHRGAGARRFVRPWSSGAVSCGRRTAAKTGHKPAAVGWLALLLVVQVRPELASPIL
jgi:hypothetical protein